MNKYKIKGIKEAFEYLSLVDNFADGLEPVKGVRHGIAIGDLAVNDTATGERLESYKVMVMADGVYVNGHKIADRENVLKVLNE